MDLRDIVSRDPLFTRWIDRAWDLLPSLHNMPSSTVDYYRNNLTFAYDHSTNTFVDLLCQPKRSVVDTANHNYTTECREIHRTIRKKAIFEVPAFDIVMTNRELQWSLGLLAPELIHRISVVVNKHTEALILREGAGYLIGVPSSLQGLGIGLATAFAIENQMVAFGYDRNLFLGYGLINTCCSLVSGSPVTKTQEKWMSYLTSILPNENVRSLANLFVSGNVDPLLDTLINAIGEIQTANLVFSMTSNWMY